MSMTEHMEKRSCDNPIYLRNLVKSLEESKENKDIEKIVQYAAELERYKVLCGYSPAIQQLEASMRRVSEELHLTENPTIERALNTAPQKTCCKCCESETRPKSGFMAQLEASRGNSNTTPSENTYPESHPNSEFTRMLEASGKNKQPHTAIPRTTIRMTGMLRQIDESQFPQFCDPEKCPPDFARHCRANTPAHFGQPCIYLTSRNR